MVAPAPADPFGGDVVVMTRDEYYVGRFQLARAAARRARRRAHAAAARRRVSKRRRKTPAARRFLVWARYPAIDVEAAPERRHARALLRMSAIAPTDRLSGPIVELAAGAVERDSD